MATYFGGMLMDDRIAFLFQFCDTTSLNKHNFIIKPFGEGKIISNPSFYSQKLALLKFCHFITNDNLTSKPSFLVGGSFSLSGGHALALSSVMSSNRGQLSQAEEKTS